MLCNVKVVFNYVFAISLNNNICLESSSEESKEFVIGPVQLLDFHGNDNKTVLLRPGSVERLFLHPLVSDRNVVIVSIGGAFRKGKSFLLNYMLRYLYANVRFIIIRKIRNDLKINFNFSIGQLHIQRRLSTQLKLLIGLVNQMRLSQASRGNRVQNVKLLA